MSKLMAMYFTATWCGPCKVFMPLAKRVLQEEEVPIVTVDVDAHEKIAMEYRVMSVPTVIFFSGTEEAGKVVGAGSEQVFRDAVKSFKDAVV
jgi:thioredoxin 1